MRRVVVLLLAGLLVLAGCTSDPKTAPGPSSTASAPTFAVACPTFGSKDADVAAGDALPDLSLPCLGSKGATVRLDGAPGVPTVINLWASWCGPCRDELTLLDQLARKAGGQVAVLGVVTLDSAGNGDSFASEKGLTFPSVLDTKGTLLQGRGLPQALPVTLLVDAQGRVVSTNFVPYKSYADLQQAVQQYLGVTVP